MAVRVVTDSTVDLSPQVAKELRVAVVPLSVIFGQEVYKEGVELSHDAFYEKLAHSPNLPTTSAPSIGDFLAAYEPLLADNDEIISIHLSSKLSATYNNACQATQQLADRSARIKVIDSQVISMAMGFIVLDAARAANDGASLEQVKALVERSIPRVHLVFLLDTLEYVRRGGRIGRAGAFLGTVLKIKPLLTLREGEVSLQERVRTRTQALERMFQIIASYPRVKEMAVGYSTNPAEAEELRRRFAEARPGVDVSVTRIGPVIGTHTGPGVLGAGLLEEVD